MGSAQAHWQLSLQPLPWSYSIQFLSNVSGAFWGAVPLLELRVSICVRMSLCVGLLRGHLGFRQHSVSGGQTPYCFSQPDAMETPLPGTGVLGWGAWYGIGTSPSREELCSWDVLPGSQPSHMSTGPACFESLHLLLVSTWLLLHILSYSSIQLTIQIVLQVNCCINKL